MSYDGAQVSAAVAAMENYRGADTATVFNGRFVTFDPDTLVGIIGALEAAGAECVRDDALVASMVGNRA